MRWLAVVLVGIGCGGVAPDDTTGTTGQQSGFGTRTLEVTVSGAHFGPAAPDSSSFVDLINQYDEFGSLTRTTLNIFGTSAAAAVEIRVAARRTARNERKAILPE